MQIREALGVRYWMQTVALDLIDRDPDQPRQDFDEKQLAKLKASIERTKGPIQKPVLKAHPEIPGRFLIIAGERRVRVLRELGYAEYAFIIAEGDLSKSYLLSAAENCNRQDLNPIEEAIMFQRMHAEGLTWAEVSEFTGRSEPTIQNKMKLLKLPAEIQEMVRKGELPQVTALNLSQYKNTRGELLRLAHDLAAGYDPTELLMQTRTATGEKMLKDRVPSDPVALLKRLLRLFGKIDALPLVIEAFVTLPDAERVKALGHVNASTWGKVRKRHARLTELFGHLAPILAAPLPASVFPAPALKEAAPKPAAPPPAPPKPAPEPARSPHAISGNGSGNGNGNGSAARRREIARRGMTPRSFPEPTAPKPAPPDPFGGKTQPLAQSLRVLTTLLTDGKGRLDINLSKENLRRRLSLNGEDHAPEVVAGLALRHLGQYWRAPMSADPALTGFLRFTAKVRADFGSPTFPRFLEMVREYDRSPDPVPLAPN